MYLRYMGAGLVGTDNIEDTVKHKNQVGRSDECHTSSFKCLSTEAHVYIDKPILETVSVNTTCNYLDAEISTQVGKSGCSRVLT